MASPISIRDTDAVAFGGSAPKQDAPPSPRPAAPLASIPAGVPDRTAFAALAGKVRRRAADGGVPWRADVAAARDGVFRLGALVGRLCALFLSVPRDGPASAAARPSPADPPFWREPSAARAAVARQLGELLVHAFALAGACGVDLRESVLKKVELNEKKYPVELCKGKSGKYTDYSQQTGISSTEGQCTVHSPGKAGRDGLEDVGTIEGVTLLIRRFAAERAWDRFHSPRNVALALMGEAGELAELFQWRGDDGGELDLDEEERDKVGQEIADVTIYLLRLADVCHVALGEVASQQLLEEES